MPTLQSTLQNLAQAFADQVVEAIRAASLQELTAVSNGAPRRARPVSTRVRTSSPKLGGGRLARRSSDDIEQTLGLVVAALGSGPMRAEEITRALGLDKKELPRVIKLGLTSKAIKKKGQKRATLYSAA
ncbi:MAG TPA: hypothetical protein VGG39_15870 [Polyangiaceae bacterium]|jgi:hypothetical protein